MGKSHLYFIAIVFPEHINKEIRKYQLEVARRYESYKSLNSPPHITLVPPFRWYDTEIRKVFQSLAKVTRPFRPFFVELNGFGSFPPRVIYVSVTPNSEITRLYEWLHEMGKTQLGLDVRKREVFHPHITIAYRDLRRNRFSEAWDFFKEKTLHFQSEINGVVLLRHGGHIWTIEQEFEFNHL
jgi:2'-5' RNA ligase